MKKIIIIILISTTLIFLYLSLDFGLTAHKIIEPYYLTDVDYSENLSISYSLDDGSYVGVGPDSIFAFTHNSDYIFGKTKTQKYIIIPLIDVVHISPDESYLGPYSLKEFNSEIENLGISHQNLIFQNAIDTLHVNIFKRISRKLEIWFKG